MSLSKQSTFTLIGISACYLVNASIGNLNPALALLANAFPEYGLFGAQFLISIAAIAVIPISLIAGSVAGSAIRLKTVIAIGLALVTIGGSVPALFDSYLAIALSRIVYGAGVGFLYVALPSYILKYYDGQAQANVLSLTGFVMCVGAIAMTILSGWLAAIDWHYCFLSFLLGLIPLATLWMVKEPLPQDCRRKQSCGSSNGNENGLAVTHANESLPTTVFALNALWLIACMCIMLPTLQVSSIVEYRGIGTGTTAGFILAFFNGGGCLGGAFYGSLYKVFKRHTLTVSLATGFLGIAISAIAWSVTMLCIGCIFAGAAYTLVSNSITMELGFVAKKGSQSKAIGIFSASMFLGEFLISFAIAGLGKLGLNMPQQPLIVAAMLIAIVCLAWMYRRNSNAKRT